MGTQMKLARSTIYRFISLLYRDEISLPLLRKLANSQVTEHFFSKKRSSGLPRMIDFLQSAPTEAVFRELRHDYAELFLNAGQNPAFPYASCHLSGEPLVMQEPIFQVRKIYHDSGVHLNPAWPDLDDHIAVELEFMAYLAAQPGNEERQADFLQNHLLSWADKFCAQLAALAKTDFYKGLAELTMAVLSAADSALVVLEPILAALELNKTLVTLVEGSAQIEPEHVVKTHCYICLGLCGQEVRVKDGVIVGCKGLAGDPKGGGRLCIKGANAHKNTYSAYRLKTPLIRENGRFRKAEWDEALDLLAAKLKSFDPKTVGFHQGNDYNSWCHDAVMAAYGTPNKTTHRQMCDNPNRMANEHCLGEKRPWIDYAHSQYILLFGINELATSAGQRKVNLLKQAVKNGAKLVVVDPRRCETAQIATEWIPIIPGTDGAMAMAMCHVIVADNLHDQAFTENWCYGFAEFKKRLLGEGDGIARTPQWAETICGVPAATITRLAHEFASAAPATAALSWTGVAQAPNATHATQAIQALNALMGSFDAPGGPALVSKFKLASAWADNQPKPPNNAAKFKLNPGRLWSGWIPAYFEEDAQAGRLKAMLCYFGNPVMSSGAEPSLRRAMERLEFSCAIDCYMSNTAELCDVVLPDCTYLEQSRVASDWMYESFISLGEKAVQPLYDSRPVVQIFTELAQRLGFGEFFPWQSEEEYMRNQLRNQRVTLEELRETGYFITDPQAFRKYEQWGSINPPSGYGASGHSATSKYNFINPVAEKAGLNALPDYLPPWEDWPELRPDTDYPLILGYFRVLEHEHTSTCWNPALMNQCSSNPVWINWMDAKKLGIADGDQVIVASPWGEIKAAAKVTWDIRQGVIAAAGGFGGRYGLEGDPKFPGCGGFNTNVLLPPNLACKWSGTPPLKYIKTRIQKA
ncbi:MAG: thiosulfate reductase [Candidatus Electronema aureum]|uniref:Thiosulfate reductase n=1 Tax=Candidatus Electronema aureum TaxID=2005002 RepID=A0A521G1W8_9BACT|nr:MAG: thiosulfate reductase [Candidatus Electronema aureum]